MSIKNKIKSIYVRRKISDERTYEERLNMQYIGKNRSALTDEEKEKIIKKWGRIAVPSFNEIEVFKYFNGFDSDYLGHNLYLPLIARRLNNYYYTKFYEDKGIMDTLSDRGVFPKSLVRCIDGEFYDGQMRQIDRHGAEHICLSERRFIIKPSRDSSGGHGVKKVVLNKNIDVGEIFESYGTDFIVQECIEQNKVMGQFNKSSVNTLRITSLYLNGECTICSIILRFGNKNSVTDNWGTGGNLGGVKKDGTLYGFIITKNFEKLHELDGKPIGEIKLDFVPELLERIRNLHMADFSLCKFIGWDVGIDIENNPVIIEVNTSQPGVFMEQIATGPIFGNRTEEVIEYVVGKKFRYNRGVFNY